MNKKESNKEKHPEAWAFFVSQSRNMEEEPDELHLGKYRIPRPNMSGDFIYANDPGPLWARFIRAWYMADHNSHSVYGQIQFIVENF